MFETKLKEKEKKGKTKIKLNKIKQTTHQCISIGRWRPSGGGTQIVIGGGISAYVNGSGNDSGIGDSDGVGDGTEDDNRIE